MSVIKPLLREVLKGLLIYLSENERLHFNKIHKPISDMCKSDLIGAIQLVERTLDNNGMDSISMVGEALGKIKLDI